jgi:hypothetical protein
LRQPPRSTRHGNDGRGGSSERRADWWRARSELTASIVDVDIALTDIVFHRRESEFEDFEERRPSSVADYAIEGLVRVAASGDEDGAAPDPTLVYVSGYDAADRLDRDEDFDQRAVCYIATDRRQDYAWRTDFYIERHVFRRLVELFATKRIDFMRISVLLKVARDASGEVELPVVTRPMLRAAGDWRRQHTRAHLMSVETSLNAAASRHLAIGGRPPLWGARMGRRRELSARS